MNELGSPLEVFMETHERPLAGRLPCLSWLNQERLPNDAGRLRAALRGIMFRAADPEIREQAREALDANVLDRVEEVVDFDLPEGMSAVAFVFDDSSVYVTAWVKGKNGKSFSFTVLHVSIAQEICREFHPGYLPRRGAPAPLYH